MNKKYLFGMALMASMTFFACSTDELTVNVAGQDSENVAEADQVISLQVFNGGDGLTTRAGRPLYGAEAKHSIDKVKLWICDNTDNEVVYVKEYTDWQTNGSVEDYNNGRQTELKLTGDDRLKNGSYTIYAVGYHTTSDYDLTQIEAITKSTAEANVTYIPNTVLAKTTGKETTPGEEIFAGSAELTVTTEKGFEQAVVLNRQVAGAFVYVKDIPFMDGASRYLRLVASNQNKKLVLGQFANTDWETNGGAGTAAKYVVNGTDATSAEYEICKIDLNNWFKTMVDENGDGLIDATVPADGVSPTPQGNNWKNPYQESNPSSYPTFRRGSVFGGAFIIPFARTGAQTLQLQLTDANGQELLSWNINLPATDLQITKGKNVTYWGQDDAQAWGWLSFAQAEDKNSYSLVRNHLYGVGNRMADNPGFTPDPDDPDKKPVDPVDPDDPSDPDPENPDPTDPDNPNPDPGIDKPESLDNKQVLILQVNDNWEIIHDMELD